MPASGSYRAYRHERPHRARRFGRSKFGIGNRAIRAFVDLLAVSWIIGRTPRYCAAEVDAGVGEPPMPSTP